MNNAVTRVGPFHIEIDDERYMQRVITLEHISMVRVTSKNDVILTLMAAQEVTLRCQNSVEATSLYEAITREVLACAVITRVDDGHDDTAGSC